MPTMIEKTGAVPPSPPRYTVPFDDVLSEIGYRLSVAPARHDGAGRTVSVVGVDYDDLLRDDGFASFRDRIRRAYDSGWSFVVVDIRRAIENGSVMFPLRKIVRGDDGFSVIREWDDEDLRPVCTTLPKTWLTDRLGDDGIRADVVWGMVSGIALVAGTDEEKPFLLPKMPRMLAFSNLYENRPADMDDLLDAIGAIPTRHDSQQAAMSVLQSNVLKATHPDGWVAIDASDDRMDCVRIEDVANRRCILVVGGDERATRQLTHGMRHYAGVADKVVVLLEVAEDTKNLGLRQLVERLQGSYGIDSILQRPGNKMSRDLLMRTIYDPGKNDYIGLTYHRKKGRHKGNYAKKVPQIVNMGRDEWDGLRVSTYAYVWFPSVPASLSDGTGYVTPIIPEKAMPYVIATEPLEDGVSHDVMLLRVRSARKVYGPGGLVNALLSREPNVPSPVSETSGIAFVPNRS